MRIEKGKYIGTIKDPLFDLLEANLRVGKNRVGLCLVHPCDIHGMLTKERATGRPQYLSMERGQHIVTVYPIADRRYDIELIGTVIAKR